MTQANLRPLETSDLENIMKWVNDPEVVGNFAELGKEITREEEEKYLERILSSDTDRMYAIEDQEGNYIGNIGIHEINKSDRSGRFGLIIGNKDYWGQGYGQSAINALLDKAFSELEMHKVWGVFLETNEKMYHINVNKVGFKVEGVMRDEYFRRGEYHDMVRISMLEDDYRKLR